MQRKKHKRKVNHVVLVTSDSVDANVRQFKIKPKILRVIIIILCILLGVIIGYITYEEKIWETALQKNIAQQVIIDELKKENESILTEYQTKEADLQVEIQGLNDKLQILSETLNEKVESEKELSQRLEKQSLPTEFPLTGSASMEESTDSGIPICIFTASEGTSVIATASGTVIVVNEEPDYGHNIWVDHGNGYVTIYRNGGDAAVKQGDLVVQGTTLFIIGKDNKKLGYQMMLEGTYIKPVEMLVISG